MKQSSTAAQEGWWSLRTAARHANLSVWSMYGAVASRELRHVRVGGRRQIRTTRRWVDQWLRQHAVGPRGPAPRLGVRT